MTFLENKKMFFSLIDEYAPKSQFFTDDEDARIKCSQLYSLAYQELADYKTRKKLKEVSISKAEIVGYEKIKLPQCKQIKAILGMDENNNKTTLDYYIVGEYIFVSNKEDVKMIIEYVPFLTLINEDTDDDFELEIDQDLQVILPYKVASDLFKTDPRRRLYSF